MNLLLDTHFLIWWATDDPTLGAQARMALADPLNQVFFSSLSIWEVAIKHSKGLLKLSPQLLHQSSLQAGLSHLPFSAIHACQVAQLPPLHSDPFDRGLIAQALCEPLVMVSRDALVQQYPLTILSY